LRTAFASNLAVPLARTDQAACCAMTGFARFLRLFRDFSDRHVMVLEIHGRISKRPPITATAELL